MKHPLRLTACLLLAACFLPFVSHGEEKYELKYGAQRTEKRDDEAMRRFRDHRVGAFIHWGLYSMAGGEWKGKIYPGAAEWLKAWAKVPADEWLAQMDRWNPTGFDAREWARMMKAAGFRYVKITTKHHEGFCLWPSATTPYTVANTPCGRDLLGELVKAFNDEGLDVHFYFSVMDWSNPDYRTQLNCREDSTAFERFKRFTEAQLRELATRYPSVKDFWFDGTWDASVKGNGAWTLQLENMLKDLVPGVTVNSRLRADERGSRHFDSNGRLMGDYESGYERRLPDPVRDLQVTLRNWEACMTVPENQWGYHKDWSLSYVKPPVEVLRRVVHAVSMGGNMAVNFGPDGTGRFRQEEKELAEWLGNWMLHNGEAIYGCGYAGFEKADWGYYTRKGDTVYMIVFNQPFGCRLRVKTPAGTAVRGASLVDGTPVGFMETARDEYNVNTVESSEPYVIRLSIDAGSAEGKYRDALT